MTGPLLEVRNLTTTFATAQGTARAVDGVSFRIARGETLALVGESGCGKTVTALSVLGLVDPPGRIDPASAVVFDGRDLTTLPAEEIRRVRGARISMIFQEPSAALNPVLSVGRQITETLHAHRDVRRAAARERAVELLRLVGLPDPASRLDSYPHQLSGGQQQRVMIAIALACEPDLLIADEPTTALDVTVQAQILELLASLRARLGMAMLLITHNLGVAAGIADRVAVMYAGRIVETAPAGSFFRRPVHPYAEGLLRAAPRLDGPAEPVAAIPGAVPPATAWPPACRFHPRCPYVFNRCRTEEPGLLAAGDARVARCWLVDETDRRNP